MGADLVSYIAVGPKEIEVDDEETIIEKVKEVQDQVRKCATELIVEGETELGEDLPAMEANRSVSIPVGPRVGEDELINEIGSVEELEEKENADALRRRALEWTGASEYKVVIGRGEAEIREIINEFVETWNEEIHWRNMATRPFPDNDEEKIVVAGERTMGGQPVGAFEVMRKGFATGIAEHFGVR